EPSPCGYHGRGPGGGGRGGSGEPGHEGVEHRRDARYLGLVQHHLGHEHRPSISRRAPRQRVAAVLAVPGRELADRHGPVVDVVFFTDVLVVVSTPGTPIVSTTLLFGSTWVPWSGFWRTTLPTFALSTWFKVDTV